MTTIARVQWCPACQWDSLDQMFELDRRGTDGVKVSMPPWRKRVVCPKCSGILVEIDKELFR